MTIYLFLPLFIDQIIPIGIFSFIVNLVIVKPIL